jgi:starvation-inducible outer membrane lipoprotein
MIRAVILALALSACVSPPARYDVREPGIQPEVGSIDWKKVKQSAIGIALLAPRLFLPIPF